MLSPRGAQRPAPGMREPGHRCMISRAGDSLTAASVLLYPAGTESSPSHCSRLG